MADVTYNVKNPWAPADTVSLNVDEDSMLNVTSNTDPSLKKRAGDLVVGDVVCHAGGTFEVIA